MPLNTTASHDVVLALDTGYRFSGATGTGTAAPFGFAASACSAGGGFTGPGTCTFKETFTPSALGPVSGSTSVSECPVAGGSCIPIVVPVQGSGISVSAADPSSIDFGGIAVGSVARVNVNVTLDGGYRFAGATGTGTAAPFAFESRTCGSGSGFTGPGTCQVRASYAPTLVGPSSGTLNLSECTVAGGTCIPIVVQLQGVGASTAAASPSSVDFGNVNVGGSAKENVRITADGGYLISGGSGSGVVAPFTLELKTCASFTGPGSCNLQETFAPTSAGPATGTLTVTECPVAGGACIPIAVALAGTGVRIATTLDLTSNRNPSHPGQSVTFKVKINPASGSDPTGTVTFMDGATPLGTVAVSSKKATLATSSLALGSHTITATYSGDATYAGSSDSLTQTVN